MKKKEEKKERVKKEYDHKHGRTQKMFNFRIDFDLLEKLQQYPNKGRAINDALRLFLNRYEKPWDDDPATGQIEDTQT